MKETLMQSKNLSINSNTRIEMNMNTDWIRQIGLYLKS